MRTGWLIAAIIMAVPAAAEPGEPAPPADFARRVLAEHNAERGRVGVPRLVWNGRLAHGAQAWADRLARDGTVRHAPREARGGAGENLWFGTAGLFPTEAMIGAFVSQKRLYRPGPFPAVSSTGRWQDVGHYTQVVWRTTREVGCGLARGSGHDVLVCRYWPAGNWVGEAVY